MNRLIGNVLYLRRKMFYPKTAEGQRRAIFKQLDKCGRTGCTRDELVVATGIPLQSVTWRVRELIKREEVVDSPYIIRPTRLGRMANVLFLNAS